MEGAKVTGNSTAVDMEVDDDDDDEIVSSDDEIDYSVKPGFYDPNLDDKDEIWVSKQRRGNTSDAVLSCPACFSTLCLDCQRHEKYVTQYRAMFVFNCKLKRNPISEKVKTRAGSNGATDSNEVSEDGEEDIPVYCSVCSTEVGAYDKDGVYHFFDVIPSNS